MKQNRAMEFLYAAQSSFPLLHDRWGWRSKQFVALAIDEVQELLDRIEELEAQHATPARDVNEYMLVVDVPQPQVRPSLMKQTERRRELCG